MSAFELEPFASRTETVGAKFIRRQPRKLLTPAAYVGPRIERSDRMTTGRRVRQSRPFFCQARSSYRKSIEPGEGLARFRKASATIPAGCAPAWNGHGSAAAHSVWAAKPLHRAPRLPPSRTRSLGFSLLIVKIDLTGTTPFPKPSRPEAAGSISAAEGCGPENSQTMAAEKADRSRTEFSFYMSLCACVAGSSGLQRRA